MPDLRQDEWGQVANTNSISAGRDYPGVGPEHSMLKDARSQADSREPCVSAAIADRSTDAIRLGTIVSPSRSNVARRRA